MNIVKNLDQYNENCVYFSEPIQNTIIDNCHFIRILYSTHSFLLNGISIVIHLNSSFIEKYYNKYKCSFDINSYKDIIEQIKNIEEGLLKKISISGKSAKFNIYEQFKNGNIKVFSESEDKIGNTFLLKIAGIWETAYEYGLTYKFTVIYPCVE
jgi:hypothetical protein